MSFTKMIELVGESDKSWEDAVQNAVHEVSGPMRDVMEVEVLRHTAKVTDGRVSQYLAIVRITFHAGHPAEITTGDAADTDRDY